ncbi:MAG: DNA-protecting protein DprA [Bifidobacteriaceae bacterium]|jgi:DNA processing protein|nr:DNA-protecting protein DprA [Bifidobacteriaceae bacterium]
MRLLFDVDDQFLARAAWSRIAEPGDADASRLVQAVGPSEALRWLAGRADRAAAEPGDAGFWETQSADAWGPPAEPDGAGQRVERLDSGGSAGPDGKGRDEGRDKGTGEGVDRAVARWLPRLADLEPARELRALATLGGRLLCPGGPSWPDALDDLGDMAPICLWARGRGEVLATLGERLATAVAVVGSRASTAYGETVTGRITADLVGWGVGIVSGGAFGIDAAAHRAALAAGGFTVAVMAGGVDRLYPAGNERLLNAVVAEGAVVSELPLGGAPRRERFLARNRLIAALGAVTVVTESGWRSGAHRTARDAAALLRPVAAVPGPVTAASSAGCHRLIREGVATLVTGSDEIRELMAPLGLAPIPELATPQGPLDGMRPADRQVFDALPKTRGAPVTSIVAASGLAAHDVMGALGRLERSGRAVTAGGLWRRTRPAPTLARGQGGAR